MTPRIEITVTPEGETSVETKGFAGPACKAASQPYEDALGSQTAERLTPEYHATESVSEQERLRA
ncbi:DUF2997 domain-containing protein [Alienimonas californiensis]|uniref:DUF2997 domain-containing protein n=1 Tax=Alienimonas californiensis TaxID=2527989 RepID=A0A517PBL9_9PLAN|nr:DUF2997 domain-containing protein [Alienimonas californiensis]QDT16778.1 hypothetical protein CA12_28850 [Alienimonas californiensis]